MVAREVTLLPRHWQWLGSQPGGASAALRRLVDEARRTHAGRDRVRRAQEAAYRFMSAMAGDEPGFEEATRALFAGHLAVVDALVEKAVGAKTQNELNTTCRALDRVLRSGRYWIPHWSKASFWIAYWDQFGFPATKPRYARGAPDTWWSDPNKAAQAGKAK